MIKFNLPTLVTLTAPTCAGKNFLLEAMVNRLGFGRIVSTTDRAPRDGEIEGLHYFFIGTGHSRQLEEAGLLAELVTYNGTRYGVTHEEMEKKMAADLPPPMVILEPNGLEIYKKYCAARGWQIFSVYVSTPESIRLERLTDRTTQDLTKASDFNTTRKIVNTNNMRLKAIIEQERSWLNQSRWDVIADGTNVDKALVAIEAGVRCRNSRSDIYMNSVTHSKEIT